MKLTKAIGTCVELETDRENDWITPHGEPQSVVAGVEIDRTLLTRKRNEISYTLCQFVFGAEVRFGWAETDSIDFGLGAKNDSCSG